jgi:hypothetical protein
MHLRPRSASALALSFFVLAVPARCGDWTAERILRDRDPQAAAAFLGDDPGREALAASDAAGFRAVFYLATDLKSVADLISSKTPEYALREGLRARPNCGFCQQPAEVESWARARLPGLQDRDLKALGGALYDWETLPLGMRRRLESSGRTPDRWSELALPERAAAVEPALGERLAELMGAFPKSEAELKEYDAECRELGAMLDWNRGGLLGDRNDEVHDAADRMKDLNRRLADVADPEMRAALGRAEAAPDLETAQSLIARIFDGLGAHDGSATVAAAPRAGQVFDDASRRVVAGLLRSGLLREISGTWAGDELNAFYATHPLDLRVGPKKSSRAVGSYSGADGSMLINERYIVLFLKAKGRDVRDLETNPALLENLTADFASLFVHEATHQTQHDWRRERGLPNISGQNDEIEAKQTAAVFVLQKSSLDPSFLAMLRNDAKTDGPAQEAAQEAQDLRDLGPAAYRAQVRAENYPDLASLEGETHENLRDDAAYRDLLEAELGRRAALPRRKADALERSKAKMPDFHGLDDFAGVIKLAATPELRAGLSVFNDRIDGKAAAYAALRDRQRRSDELTESRLARLGFAAPAKNGIVVPSPAP